MVNELEAAALAGTSAEGDFRDILKALQKKYPKAAIVMTLGKDGVLYGYKEEFYSHPIFKVNAVDTTAAGDTFCGSFLLTSLLSSYISPFLQGMIFCDTKKGAPGYTSTLKRF